MFLEKFYQLLQFFEQEKLVKVIKSLENRGILLKGTTRKIINRKGGFLN